MPKDFYLYPIIRVTAEDEAEATDMVIEAIFTARVGEIPGWRGEPPSYEEERLQRAAPEMLAVLEVAIKAMICPCCGRDNSTYPDGCSSDDCPGVAAIARARRR
jgi:hypothetical protein